MHADSLQTNAYGLVYARLFNCAAASLPWRLLRTYLESCANIVQAVVYCPPYRPPSCWQSVARRCWLKKSVQIHARSCRGRHCSVAQASSDHPRRCRPHPVYRSHLRLTKEATRNRNAFFAIFPASHCPEGSADSLRTCAYSCVPFPSVPI